MDIADSAFAPLKETKGAFALYRVNRKNQNCINEFLPRYLLYDAHAGWSHLGVLI